ncbi:J domain-containing protein required for chloroplast accumulation response 1 [Zea mays]|uniref:J domain-containing protein required for chloroplast accumulation response 1 n=1 Tax=Zea mays TaxID=4577 RepID=A0A1D6PIA3_MAIZE|nr:J domain-containing protein required for chloroplast accumulation response 1 [Zea mays]
MAGAPLRRSDLDFADVFGGPPRRVSGNEHRSQRGSQDTSSFESATRAGSGGPDTPVFGDRGSSDRRRQLGEEFYKDIFPGSEAASPRRSGAGDWGNVFGAQASPVSTARPRSSFSIRFNRGMDSSMPTSPSQQMSNRNDDGTSYAYSVPTSPNASMNNYLAQGAARQDSKKNPFSWHRYPFLSRFRSQSGEKKSTSNHVSSMDNEFEGTPVNLESIMANNKFHFSFYKWAGKGALLVLPATAQEKSVDIIGLRSFPQVVIQGIDLIDCEDSMSTATGTAKNQTDYEDSKSGKHSANSATKDGAIPLLFEDYMQGNKYQKTIILLFRVPRTFHYQHDLRS